MFINIKKIISTSLIAFLPFAASAQTRVKDIAAVEGVRENLLVGHGLVVGLSGTGDNLKNTVFTKTGLTDFLERLGVNVQGADIKTKNIAAVTVTASLPPFARLGTKIDVKVGALGDAKSLKGGTLLATPLLGADGNVYAVAQGAIALANFTPNSGDVKTKSIGVETNGYIQSGAIVENEIDFSFGDLQTIKFSLYSPDFATAIAVASAINDNVSGNTARALDAATIEVAVPSYRQGDIVEFIARIEGLEVKPDYKAKIVINESTGTVVIGDKVNIRPVAIAQGNLIVNVGKPAEYYEIIDRNKVNSVEKSTSSDKTASASSVHPNRFNEVLDAQKAANTAPVKVKNPTNSRVARAQNALNAQVAKAKASVKPTQADMDSLINASGLTNNQINQLIGAGQKPGAKGINTPSGLRNDKIGTNLALKKLAKEMEIQIMGMFFTLMDNAREANPEGGFGEQLFRGQYLTEIVKDSSSTELGEIGLAIYRSLVKEDNIKDIRDVRK